MMCTNARPASLHDKQLGCYGLTTGTHKEQICGAKTMQGGHATIQMARFKLQIVARHCWHELKHNAKTCTIARAHFLRLGKTTKTVGHINVPPQ